MRRRWNVDGMFLLGKRFSLAECNTAPFLQRCCAILPEFTGVDPLQLCDELGLGRLKGWIEAVLARPSVVKTGVSMEGMRESILCFSFYSCCCAVSVNPWHRALLLLVSVSLVLGLFLPA
jgi:hypothetical protein